MSRGGNSIGECVYEYFVPICERSGWGHLVGQARHAAVATFVCTRCAWIAWSSIFPALIGAPCWWSKGSRRNILAWRYLGACMSRMTSQEVPRSPMCRPGIKLLALACAAIQLPICSNLITLLMNFYDRVSLVYCSACGMPVFTQLHQCVAFLAAHAHD